LALSETERRQCALAVLRQRPLLWIWDNVEPITGFPTGTDTAWSKQEQVDLASFLRALRETKAKVLLTSRRDESGWLGDFPLLVQVPPMPLRERQQLAEALIALRSGDVRTLLPALEPLIEFSQGNPLTLTVLVSQALKKRISGETQTKAWVGQLRIDEKAFEDDAEQGRSRSLGASLVYGFENAFDETERRQLALLHLFQDGVNAVVLVQMGAPTSQNTPTQRSISGEPCWSGQPRLACSAG
jgi:hypothetical protein